MRRDLIFANVNRAHASLLIVAMMASVLTTTNAEMVLRRTTLLVFDIEASIRFYSAAGYNLTYDTSRSSDDPRGILGGEVLPFSEKPGASRIVILQGPNPDSGMIGLLAFDDPKLPALPRGSGGLRRGGVILMMTVTDITATHAALADLDVRFHKQPHTYTVEDTQGNLVAIGVRMFVYDPDGHLVEITQPESL